MKAKRALEGGHHLGAAWMTDEAADIVGGNSELRQHVVERRREPLLDEGRHRAGEDDAEPLRIDGPAHHVERVGPVVLAAALEFGEAALVGAEHAGRAAVAEQRRRDQVRDLEVVEPEGERAQLDRDHQDVGSGPRLGEPCCDREAADAAGAAAPEHRHAQDVLAKAHAREHQRIEARRRDAGRGEGHDRVDIDASEPGLRQRRLGGLHEQRRRTVEIGLGALGPSARLEVPLERAHAVPLQDADALEDAGEALELPEMGLKHLMHPPRHVRLPEKMRWQRRRERKEVSAPTRWLDRAKAGRTHLRLAACRIRSAISCGREISDKCLAFKSDSVTEGV